MTRDLISERWATAGAGLPSSMAEWEILLAQARATRLSARLALQLADAAVPPRVAQHLHSALRLADAVQVNALHEVRQLAHALAPLGTPVVVLKGAAYAVAGLPAARGRLFSDIDILVDRKRLRDVEDALFGAGWLPEKLKPYDDRYYRRWMHELPPMQHVRRHSNIDVHHTLAPPTSRFVIDGMEMLARSVPLAIPGMPAANMRILAPTDLVLHSALHLMQEGEFHAGLRDLLDIRDLLLHFAERDPGFWVALQARAAALGLEHVMAQVLLQLQRLFGFIPPLNWGWPVRTWRSDLLKKLLSQVLVPPSADEGFGSRSARLAMYVRSHWLRMHWYQIGPHIVRKALARLTDRASEPRRVGAGIDLDDAQPANGGGGP